MDDIFDAIDFYSTVTEGIKRHGKSETLKQVAAGSRVYPFIVKERNSSTILMYRQIPLPWYVTMQCFAD